LKSASVISSSPSNGFGLKRSSALPSSSVSDSVPASAEKRLRLPHCFERTKILLH
jgi:hypothetical protein